MIGTLLHLGARLCSQSLPSAVARQEPAVFELLLEVGWNMDSLDFNRAAIQ
jgi:hypothetical protein